MITLDRGIVERLVRDALSKQLDRRHHAPRDAYAPKLVVNGQDTFATLVWCGGCGRHWVLPTTGRVGNVPQIRFRLIHPCTTRTIF